MITASEILGKMSDLLEAEGWIQHEAKNEEGLCMIGAYQDVLAQSWIEPGMQPVAQEALRAIHLKILELDPPSYGPRSPNTIVAYNDKAGRTKSEVVTMLDKARIGLEEQGK